MTSGVPLHLTPEEHKAKRAAYAAAYRAKQRVKEAASLGLSIEEYEAQQTARNLATKRRSIEIARARMVSNAAKERRAAGMPVESMRATGDATADIRRMTHSTIERCSCGLKWADHTKVYHGPPGITWTDKSTRREIDAEIRAVAS
jgi:hypothetical protein